MAGLNLTGQPQPGDYFLGRGKLYIATRRSSGLPGAWRAVGNATEVSVAIEVETVEHQTSQQSVRIVDAECILSLKATLGFTLDELSYNNLAEFFLGNAEVNPVANPAIAGVTNVLLVDVAEGVTQGRWYDLTDGALGAGERIYDIASANLSVRRDIAGVPTLVPQIPANYTIDEKFGRIFVPVGSAILAGDDIDFTLSADAGALPVDQMCALTQAARVVALKFLSDDGCSGKQHEIKFHAANLRPEGELALIGDEFATIGFEATAQADVANYASCPYFWFREHDNS